MVYQSIINHLYIMLDTIDTLTIVISLLYVVHLIRDTLTRAR